MMDWLHIKADASRLLDEQWLMRIDNTTVGSLAVDEDEGVWRVTMLDPDGDITTGRVLAYSLQEAQTICELQLQLKGWRK